MVNYHISDSWTFKMSLFFIAGGLQLNLDHVEELKPLFPPLDLTQHLVS